MKITSFNPMIFTQNPEDAIKTFEALGFEQRHRKVGLSEYDAVSIRMKDANGFHVDVMNQSDDVPRDMTVIRMNVDDFGKAYNLLKDLGFKNSRGNALMGTGSSYAALMVAPSGFGIYLVKHVKEEDR